MQPADRTEIEGNDLVQATLSIVDRIRPHVATIAAAVGVALAAFGGWTLYSSQQVAERAASWDACLAAVTAGDAMRLRDVSGRYANTPAAAWAQILLADGALADGCRLAFLDKQRGREQCQAAADLYSGVLSQRPGELAAERAAFGLAKAREALGQLDQARQGYETLAAEHAEGPLRVVAEERAKAIARPAVKGWYAWFDGLNVTPPTTTDPAAPAGGAAERLLPGAGG
jgi:hypothetical protein